jgi:hypothetical protein
LTRREEAQVAKPRRVLSNSADNVTHLPDLEGILLTRCFSPFAGYISRHQAAAGGGPLECREADAGQHNTFPAAEVQSILNPIGAGFRSVGIWLTYRASHSHSMGIHLQNLRNLWPSPSCGGTARRSICGGGFIVGGVSRNMDHLQGVLLYYRTGFRIRNLWPVTQKGRVRPAVQLSAEQGLGFLGIWITYGAPTLT